MKSVIVGVMILMFGGMVAIQWVILIQKDQEIFQIHRALKRSLTYMIQDEDLYFMDEEMLQFKEDFINMAPSNYEYTIHLQGYIDTPKMRKIAIIANKKGKIYTFVEAMVESEWEE